MIKLYVDNTSKISDFHLYETYLYRLANRKNCFLVNNFADDNSDIKNFNITIENAYNILLNHVGETYEVIIITELKNDGPDLLTKIFEIDENIAKKFKDNNVQKAKKVAIVILDYTGNNYFDFFTERYVVKTESSEFFYEAELRTCQTEYFEHKNVEKFVQNLKKIGEMKAITENNKWYLNIFNKMIEHFYDERVISSAENGNEDIVEIFKKMMSYYVRKEMIENKLILRYDMLENSECKSILEKSFNDMSKLLGLLLLNARLPGFISKNVFLKGIYELKIELNRKSFINMIMQYSENLKSQLQMLLSNKVTTIKAQKRVMPNVTLNNNVFLEPVKVKKERLTWFRSSKDIQYMDRIEKYITNLVNKKIQKLRNNNVKNICELRTLRYFDDVAAELEKLSLIELENKIQEKRIEYERKLIKSYENKADYYELLDEFLARQKTEKEKITSLMERKISLNKFAFWNLIAWIIAWPVIFMTYPDVVNQMKNKEMFAITLGTVALLNLIITIVSLLIDNSKIRKQIEKYVEFVNSYNSKFQISSEDEKEKLTRAYELIIINSDIEYYSKKYKELVNNINMQEFHINQLEKHINVAKRLCERVGIDFNDIVVANNSEYDEIIAEIDVKKDVYKNECYDLIHFLLETDKYDVTLNGRGISEKVELKTYLKNISFGENEVYRF